MKAALTRALLFIAGLTLIAWGMLPSAATSVGAAPLLLVTETTTGEPSTPTSEPSPTATEIGQLTPIPTSPPSDTPEPDDDDPRPTATPTALPPTPTLTPAPTASIPADPAISKSVSPGSARVGDSVEYTISVTNLGGAVATGVVVDDTLPAFLRPTGATSTRGEVSLSGQSVRVTIGDLSPGETVTISVQATVVAPATPPNNRNLAIVTSTSPDANPDNNQASVPLDTIDAPVSLPNTGDEGRGMLPLAALLLGVALVASSLWVRRRAA
jgi:uncharacterized repeat protein (TIGR01451 family)/LPXTG-motif cell wall-anchored protein